MKKHTRILESNMDTPGIISEEFEEAENAKPSEKQCPVLTRRKSLTAPSACPFIPVQSMTNIASEKDVPDIEHAFRNENQKELKARFETLRRESAAIEENSRIAEAQMLRLEEESFTSSQMEKTIAKTIEKHTQELLTKKQLFETLMKARRERKRYKASNRMAIRDIKVRDQKIFHEEMVSSIEEETSTCIAEKREYLEDLVSHTQNLYEKMRRQVISSHERSANSQKVLNDLETRHLREEQRNALLKKFQVQVNHQKAIDKKVFEHMREVQRQKLKGIKEKFEIELKGYEEIQSLKAMNLEKMYELTSSQQAEISTEKERLITAKENFKFHLLETSHQIEMKKLATQQKVVIKSMKDTQRKIYTERKSISRNSSRFSKNLRADSNNASRSPSRGTSVPTSRSNSLDTSILVFDEFGEEISVNNDTLQGFIPAGGNKEGLEKIQQMEQGIKALIAKHKEARQQLASLQAEELEKKEKLEAALLLEFQESQDFKDLELRKSQEAELKELKAVQEKEIALEQSVHDAEYQALIERRLLKSVLDTVIYGIVNIETNGTITRFNNAAEKIFGYKATEVIGSILIIIGQNIKILMPPEHAKKHDGYLENYLSTGIKKVVGFGRQATAQKKDGTIFPVHLSISEVKEDGTHLFTGIVRDMTEENRLAEIATQSEIKKQNDMKNLIRELDESRRKSDELISQILPSTVAKKLMEGIPIKPESFENCTVMFTDIVGFTNFSSETSPFAIVNMLNRLYSAFDTTISQYDAYKVETIGDSYMVVSGIPIPNGKNHASEIATLALHLLSKVHLFRFPDDPEKRLQIRIGINTGPAVAGVVGQKMPRYCLFGDTVDIASKMESNGAPMKIHISQSTYKLLNSIGGFTLHHRGEINVKGKGIMTTFWLTGKEGFEEELPKRE